MTNTTTNMPDPVAAGNVGSGRWTHDGPLASAEIDLDGTNLSRSADDYVTGEVAINVPPDVDMAAVTDDHVRGCIHGKLPGSASLRKAGLSRPSDIESVELTRISHGRGFVFAHVKITPTEAGRARWGKHGKQADKLVNG